MASSPVRSSPECPDALRFLIAECLQAAPSIPKDSVRKPFTLPLQQWLGILVSTCFRLGWFSESSSSERALKSSIMKTIHVLGLQTKNALTFQDVASLLDALTSSRGQPLPHTAAGMWREGEQCVVDSLRKRILKHASAVFHPPSQLVAVSSEQASQSPQSARFSLASSASSMIGRKRLSFSDRSMASRATGSDDQMVSSRLLRNIFRQFHFAELQLVTCRV